MFMAIDCDQRDPSANTMDDALIDRDEREWQIPTYGAPPKPTKGFHHRDFRNPLTGESIVPTQVYVALRREVQSALLGYELRIFVLVLVILMIVALIQSMEIFFKDVDLTFFILIKIALFVGAALLVFFIWKTGMQWFNQSLHARMGQVVEEHQGTLMEYGVELGYSHKTTWCYRNCSHLWLRRIPEAQLLHSRTTNCTPESTRDEEQQLFPPIFIHFLVPGEIHISEKEYDPSMIFDREVWTMLQKAHTDSIKPCNRYLAILMAALTILLFAWSILISYFIYLFGDLEAWLGYFGILCAFLLTWYALDRLNVKTWSQLADQVTLLLLAGQSPNLTGFQLKFETSLFPYRKGPLSRRYQLVRIQGNHSPHDSGIVDGNGDYEDCENDEHHMV